jgi:hypothetical protein
MIGWLRIPAIVDPKVKIIRNLRLMLKLTKIAIEKGSEITHLISILSPVSI